MSDNYKVIKEIGKGGFSQVFLVKRMKYYYAMKKINISNLNKEEIEKAENEIKILSKFNSDYIVKYYDSYKEDNYLVIIMEFVGEMNLKDFIKQQKDKNELIEEKIIQKIIIQICLGLKEIHKAKIIHRDLTPENIFINKLNKIKIGDFGISKILNPDINLANSIIGKYNYLAPEIQNRKNYDYKVDIYSLGCIIYELFTLNEYYTDKEIDKNEAKINIDIYNKKWQDLIDLLLHENCNERPDAQKIYDYIIKINNYDIKQDEYNEKEMLKKKKKKEEDEKLNKEEKSIINSYKISQQIIELYNKIPEGEEKGMIRYLIKICNSNNPISFDVDFAENIKIIEQNQERNEIRYRKKREEIKIINQDIFNILKKCFSFKKNGNIEDASKQDINFNKETIGKFQKNNFKNAFNDIFSEKGLQHLNEQNEINIIFLLEDAFDQIKQKMKHDNYDEQYDKKILKKQFEKERKKEINKGGKLLEVNIHKDQEGSYYDNNKKIKISNEVASIEEKKNFISKIYLNEDFENKEKIFTKEEIKNLGFGYINFVENQNAIIRMIDKYKFEKIKSSSQESIDLFEKEIEENNPKLLEFLNNEINNNLNNNYHLIYLILNKYKIIENKPENKDEEEYIVSDFINDLQSNYKPKDKKHVIIVLIFKKLLKLKNYEINIEEKEYNNIIKEASELYNKLKYVSFDDIQAKNWKITSKKIVNNFMIEFNKFITKNKIKNLIDDNKNYIASQAIINTILDNYIINKLKNFKEYKIEELIFPLDDKWIGIKDYIKLNDPEFSKKTENIFKNKNKVIIYVKEYLFKYPLLNKNCNEFIKLEINKQKEKIDSDIIKYIEDEQIKYINIFKEKINNAYIEFIENINKNDIKFKDWKNNKMDEYHKEFVKQFLNRQKEEGINIDENNIESKFKEEIKEMDNKIKENLTLDKYKIYLKEKYPEEKWKKDYKWKLNNQQKKEYFKNQKTEISEDDKLEAIKLIKNKLNNCHEINQLLLLILNEKNKNNEYKFIEALKTQIINLYINNNNLFVKFILSDYINAIKYNNTKFYDKISEKMKKQFKYSYDKMVNYITLKLNSLNSSTQNKISYKEELKNNIKTIVENDTLESIQANILDNKINFGAKMFKDEIVDTTIKQIEDEEKYLKEKIEKEKKEAEKKKNEEEIKKILEDVEDTIKKHDNFVKKYGL